MNWSLVTAPGPLSNLLLIIFFARPCVSVHRACVSLHVMVPVLAPHQRLPFYDLAPAREWGKVFLR